MKALEMPAVLTLGHSNRTWKDFLQLLRAHCVKRVTDVRSIPRSRHNPQFNPLAKAKPAGGKITSISARRPEFESRGQDIACFRGPRFSR